MNDFFIRALAWIVGVIFSGAGVSLIWQGLWWFKEAFK